MSRDLYLITSVAERELKCLLSRTTVIIPSWYLNNTVALQSKNIKKDRNNLQVFHVTVV